MRGSHRRHRRRRQAAGVGLAFTGLLISFLLTLGQLGLIAASAADGSSGFDAVDSGKTASSKFDSDDSSAEEDRDGDSGAGQNAGGGSGSGGDGAGSSGSSGGGSLLNGSGGADRPDNRRTVRVSTPDPDPDCGGAFSGNPAGSLAKSAASGGGALSNGDDVVIGQQITYTITWNTGDWSASELDKVADCFIVDGPGTDPDVSSLNAGEKPTDNDGSFVHTIAVPATLTPGEDKLCDRARLSDASTTIQVDTQKSNTICLDVVAAQQNVDVSISKGPATQSINNGGTATFDITVTNIGNAQATNVVVTDTLPSGLTPATAQFGPNTSSLSNCPGTPITGQTVTCNVGNLAAGGSVVVRITATETGALCQYQNSASVSAGNETGTTNNNTSGPVTVNVNCAVDVSISKGPATQSVNDGGTATFDITVTNTGTQQATSVIVTDTLPAGLTPATAQFGATTSSLGNCTNATPISGQTVTCNVGNLAAGASVIVRITASETGSLCQYQNSASVSASNETTGAGSNNTSGPVTVNVNNCQPSLALSKAGTATVTNGGAVTYTVTVTNSGNAAATGVVITDELDDSFTSVTASSTIGTCSVGAGNLVTCNVGTLNAGQSATITINATAPAGTCPTITNQATGSHSGGTIPSSNTVTTTVTGCVTPPPEITVRIEKTNDANEDGIFTNNEEASDEGQAVDFHLVITNTSDEIVEITDLTDSFDQTTIDLLADECPALDGAVLDAGESVECTFTLPNYSPEPEGEIVNVAEVCVIMVGDTSTACDTNPSRVTSREILGRTVTPTSPPPTTTPPGGIAFTGPVAVVPLAGLALFLLTVGSGLLWASSRRRSDGA